MNSLKRALKTLIPKPVLHIVLPAYHHTLALLGATLYRFPSRQIAVIGVTGTKGKSSTLEFLNAIFEAAEYRTALLSTVRIKIARDSKPNLMRMTMPGRMFVQRFLRKAVRRKCQVAFIEMTSEGAKQHRHRYIFMDGLVFTNLSPEHIESHGSLEAYAQAKLSIGRALVRSPKRPRVLVANADDPYGRQFLALTVDESLPFSMADSSKFHLGVGEGTFTFHDTVIHVNLPGAFNIANALAAATLAYGFGIDMRSIKSGIESIKEIPGRVQEIEEGQPFPVVVDYAHTPDSLEALYKAYPDVKKVCVLGATGGGRDKWKRPEMGKIAETYCTHVILTNEDPYDEDPEQIIEDVAGGMTRQPERIIDRRLAIRRALALADEKSAVLISGKGTDPCICGPRGTQIPWSDADVAREELRAYRDTTKHL